MKKIHLVILYTFMIAVVLYLIYDHMQRRNRIVYVDNLELFEGFQMKTELEKKYKETEDQRKAILDSLLTQLKVRAQTGGIAASEELGLLKKEFLTRKELFDKENAEMMSRYNEQIWNQLNEYTAQYSKEKGYEFVFGANGQGVLMYATDTKNVTKELLEFVNTSYHGK